jgi:hypothetical protein
MRLEPGSCRDGTLPPAMSVKEVMDSWTLQTGFPVITVNRNYQDGTAIITQVCKQLGCHRPDSPLSPFTGILRMAQPSSHSLLIRSRPDSPLSQPPGTIMTEQPASHRFIFSLVCKQLGCHRPDSPLSPLTGTIRIDQLSSHRFINNKDATDRIPCYHRQQELSGRKAIITQVGKQLGCHRPDSPFNR